MTTEDGKQGLKSFLSTLSKKYEVVVDKIKDYPKLDVLTIKSGSYGLDHAIGVGGYPRGRVIEIFGKQAGGKTLLSLLAIAEAQKAGDLAAFIDVECSLDIKRAKTLGVNTDELVYVQPEHGDKALDILQELVASGRFAIVVLDSVAALLPKEEAEAESVSDQFMGLQARLVGRALRKLIPTASETKTAVIFVNQVRDGLNPYGEKQTRPGGKALDFYASVMLEVKKISGSEIKNGTEILGQKINICVRKNKVAPPFREAELTVMYHTGVDEIDDLVTFAIDNGIIEQKGAFFTVFSERFQGKAALIEHLRQTPPLFGELKAKVLEVYKTL